PPAPWKWLAKHSVLARLFWSQSAMTDSGPPQPQSPMQRLLHQARAGKQVAQLGSYVPPQSAQDSASRSARADSHIPTAASLRPAECNLAVDADRLRPNRPAVKQAQE